MLGAIAANVAFLASPAMPSRALNGALCFMILSISFVAHSAFTKFNKASIYLSVTTYAMAFYISSHHTSSITHQLNQ